ncbi:hypothetical protein B0J14DRAFT_560838 [Halenospora varia]|nr:hypothetical protein B0J14DRAFT_560838 [Halenospora varia]
MESSLETSSILRCSAKLDYPDPCPRCKRLGLVCTIENGFRRVNKRQKSAILQRENQLLRERLSLANASTGSRISTSPSEAEISHSPQSAMSRQGNVDFRAPDPVPESFHQNSFNMPVTLQPTTSSTLSRILGGIQLEPQEIDELFALYFLRCAKHLPFLDSQITPNAYYEQSPLLFWAIISAGSRRYTANPNLYALLAEPVLELAWSKMHTSGSVIPNIQGLLILTTWPFPTNSTSKDNTFTLSGMSVNLALQIGLHVPLQGQEYSRTRIDLSNDNIARRVQLWSYCVVVHQKKLDLNGVMDFAPRSLQLELKLASIIGRINSVFSDFSFDDLQNQPQAAPAMMLEVFEAQLNELDREEAAVTALKVIDMAGKLDKDMDLASFCPHYVYRMVALATSVLLRVLKTSLARYVADPQAGRTSFLLAISLLKKMSVSANDMPSRMAGILSQLWTSEKVFKGDTGGQGSATMRIQSRMSMSSLHDMMWRWREEYAGQAYENAKISRSKDQNAETSNQKPAGNQTTDPLGKVPEPEVGASVTNNGLIPATDLMNMSDPVLSDDLLALDDNSAFLWDPIDHGFESMIELFPDSWPL